LYQDVASSQQVFVPPNTERGIATEAGARCGPSASQLFDAESKLSGVIISVRDITVEKKLEQTVVQSERWPRWDR